jgi:hypothetical protein
MTRLALLFLLAGSPALAQIDMPDPSQMAGKAIPAPELPDGTVTVRVVREALGNNLPGQQVTVTAGGVTQSGTTDETGRARITGLPAGATGTAGATVDGERLTSDPFEVPRTGGIRVVLVSGLAQAKERRAKEDAAAKSAPPVKGTVVIGPESRLIFEFQNDRLSAFYLLEIVNTARTRVDTGGPLIVQLPEGAGGARLMEGSFAGATAQGDRVTIAGPFPPGTSSVQIGFQLLHSSDALTIVQRFPVSLQRVAVFVEQVGSVAVSSPQLTEHGHANAGDGTAFVTGTGGALAANSDLVIHLTNLPHAPTWPRNVALGLAALIVAAGIWLARGRTADDQERKRLSSRRDALYKELVKLEDQHRTGRVDEERYQTRRAQLVAELERIYGELDDRPGTGEGDGAAA